MTDQAEGLRVLQRTKRMERIAVDMVEEAMLKPSLQTLVDQFLNWLSEECMDEDTADPRSEVTMKLESVLEKFKETFEIYGRKRGSDGIQN